VRGLVPHPRRATVGSRGRRQNETLRRLGNSLRAHNQSVTDTTSFAGGTPRSPQGSRIGSERQSAHIRTWYSQDQSYAQDDAEGFRFGPNREMPPCRKHREAYLSQLFASVQCRERRPATQACIEKGTRFSTTHVAARATKNRPSAGRFYSNPSRIRRRGYYKTTPSQVRQIPSVLPGNVYSIEGFCGRNDPTSPSCSGAFRHAPTGA